MNRVWSAPGHDPESLRTVAGTASSIIRYLEENFDDYEAYDMWMETLANNHDEFGRGMLDCVVKHERKAGRDCAWEMSVVVGQDSDSAEGSVLYVQQSFYEPSARIRPTCIAYAECIAALWENRVAPPLPKDGPRRIALSGLGMPATIRGSSSDPAQYRKFYEEAKRSVEESLLGDEEQEQQNTLPHTIHNARLSRALLAHIDTVLESIDDE